MAVPTSTRETRFASDDERALENALLRAFNGNYRQVAVVQRLFAEQRAIAPAYHDALYALLLGREGQMPESRAFGAAAFDAFVADERFAFAVALARSTAWFEYACGNFDASRTCLQRARELSIRTGLPHWEHTIRCAAGHVAAASGAISEAVDLLQMEPCHREACAAAHLASSVELAVVRNSRDLSAANFDLGEIDRAFDAGRYHEGYTMVTALASGWRKGLIAIDMHNLTRLALRGQADPLQAFEILLDVTQHGTAQDAAEAASLLQSAVRSQEQRLVSACAQLGHAFMHIQNERRPDAAGYAAEAAKAFNGIAAVPFQGRAMDVLVRTSGTAILSAPHNRLTKRQRQVLVMLRAGHRNKEIARTLGIAEHTVERHVSVILAELNLRSRWQLLD